MTEKQNKIEMRLGMDALTMRDYFAAAAITGWLATGNEKIFPILAVEAYALADAMLKTRIAPSQPEIRNSF